MGSYTYVWHPGGPGGSGISFLYNAGSALVELLDNRYDIVSWDPRGVNGTIPRVKYYESQTAQDIAFSHTYFEIGLEARNLSDPIDRAVYTQQACSLFMWVDDDVQDADQLQAGPGRCALNTNNTSTVAAIQEAVDKLIQDLYEHPLPVPLGKQPYILTSGMIRSVLLVSMYPPRTWAELAEQLTAAMRDDGAPIADALIKTIELDTTVRAKTVMATAAVVCADGPGLRDVELDQAIKEIVEAIVLTYETVSRRFSVNDPSSCYHSKVREAERFVGPFNHTDLANDILIIGNTADPVTPLASARLVNELLSQSRLVIQDGSGHCSDAMASPCTGKVLRSYLLDGVLPPNGIVCDTVEELFPKPSGDAGEQNSWLKADAGLSEEDVQLAKKLRALGQAMTPHAGLRK
ncbi:hypothetical protein FRC07_004466 [Ceratobasidium sp. 392]|nr:hypothetical protein FRC07_004466 [Ceratobasidium sp. 392]